ncbi:hypothetical protein ANO11243_054690 [Dothideomycetidae sp. 11243]|nr:hypothetical protein ANO11243_054690 [fungal sp. No.11243]
MIDVWMQEELVAQFVRFRRLFRSHTLSDIQRQYPHRGFGLPLRSTAYSFARRGPARGPARGAPRGAPRHYGNSSPTIAEYIPTTGYNIEIEKDGADVLQDNGVPSKDIEAIFWSHWHWDDIVNPDRFPKSTALIVGQGFKKAMLPGAPANPRSPILESDYTGRELKEIEFGFFQIGPFPAHDFFGHGSFYLPDSPGHAIGHLCGLARTTTDTFVLLGGGVCHHAGIFRPSKHLPVPASISPHPLSNMESHFCPGHAWEELQKSRGRAATDPLLEMTFDHDITLATDTKRKLQELDCNNNVLVINAHGASVRDHFDRFLKSLNDWKAKGLGKKLRWDFSRELSPYWKAKGLA